MIIILTIEFLIKIFDDYGGLLSSFALNMIGSDCLSKLLNSPLKQISSAGRILIKRMICNAKVLSKD